MIVVVIVVEIVVVEIVVVVVVIVVEIVVVLLLLLLLLLSLLRGYQHLLHQLRLHVGRGLLSAKFIPPTLNIAAVPAVPAEKDNDKVILE